MPGVVIEEAGVRRRHRLEFRQPKIDLDKLRAMLGDKVVKQLTGGLAGMAKQRKVRVVEGVGKFISPNEIEVEGKDGKKLVRFGKAIIAAGSQWR